MTNTFGREQSAGVERHHLLKHHTTYLYTHITNRQLLLTTQQVASRALDKIQLDARNIPLYQGKLESTAGDFGQKARELKNTQKWRQQSEPLLLDAVRHE